MVDFCSAASSSGIRGFTDVSQPVRPLLGTTNSLRRLSHLWVHDLVATWVERERDAQRVVRPYRESAPSVRSAPVEARPSATGALDERRVEGFPDPSVRNAPVEPRTSIIGIEQQRPEEAAQNKGQVINIDLQFFAEVGGTWATDRKGCPGAGPSTVRPITITSDRAVAGNSSCLFQQKSLNAEVWSVAAVCSSPGKRWDANIRLSREGNILRWASERGVETYYRC